MSKEKSEFHDSLPFKSSQLEKQNPLAPVPSLCWPQATECVDEEAECSLLCKARLDHLKSYASGEQTEGMKTAWRQTRVDRMLVDHFLRAGYYTAAHKLSQSSGIEVSAVLSK